MEKEAKVRSWSAADERAGDAAARVWEQFFKATKPAGLAHSAEVEASHRIGETQQRFEQQLLALKGVNGVGVGLKMKGTKPTNEWSLVVLVEKKVPKAKLSKADLVPENVDGVATDVLEVGKLEALAFNAKVRPALPGFSIGHHDITAGTLGCIVRDIRTQDFLILSNNHVLANVNRAKPGDLILQPGPFDGGLYPSDAIATLERFEPIVLSEFQAATGYNLVDAAVARPLYSRNITASIIGQVMPTGLGQASVGGVVVKAGRTTQVTVGRVLLTNATVVVGYGIGFGLFRHQIITTAMSAGGDSGSLLMDQSLRAVGLLYAGSPFVTIHNHINDVEIALGVRPVTAAG